MTETSFAQVGGGGAKMKNAQNVMGTLPHRS